MADKAALVEEYKASGNSSYQKGAYEDAVEWYTRAIDEDEQNALLYSNRSAGYLMLKNYLKAFDDANKSLELNPNYCKALVRLVKCCISLGKLQEAKNACITIRQVEPSNTELPNLNHQIDLLQENFQQYEKQLAVPELRYALHLLSKCIEIAPGSVEYNLKKVGLLIRLKRFTEAKQHVEYILKTNEPSVEVLYYRGLCLFYLDHLDKAVSHFQHVLRLHPDHVETQQSIKRAKTLLRLKDEGNRYIHERRFSKAYETYTDALRVDNLHDAMNSKLFCNRACAGYNLEKYEAALEDCNRAIELDASYVRAFVRRAKCYAALELYDKAVEEWTNIVSMDSSNEHKHGLQAAKHALAQSKESNYYKVLGVKKTATVEEVKQAYKKLALQHHPDRHTHADDATKQEEEQKFKEIGEAYSVISDQEKRQQYDSGMYSPDGSDHYRISFQELVELLLSDEQMALMKKYVRS